MPRSFNVALQNPSSIARLVIGVLVAANLVAAYFVVRPPGGSPEDLRNQVRELSSRLRQKKAVLDRTRVLVSKIQAGREQGDDFLQRYFLPANTAYSTVYSEIIELAKEAQMKAKESTYSMEPIEGSDTLSLMTVTQALEGSYPQLIHFINALDKSQQLLIIESLQATPQSSGGLTVQMKLQTYVREDAASQ
jgi:type IV pilus assembly protein PilO